jgi:hypothetical protein
MRRIPIRFIRMVKSIGRWYQDGMPPYTYVHFYSVLRMNLKLTWVMMIPRM